MIKKEKKLQKLYLTDYKYIVSSISNLVNNLGEGIHKVKYKYGHDGEKWETCGIK